MLKYSYNFTKNRIARLWAQQFNFVVKNTIFLAGVGRSGTTWLTSIINSKNEYRRILEPFHPHRLPLVKHFEYHQYLRPGNGEPLFLDPAKQILSGRFRNKWADGENTKLFSHRRIVKDIRANLMLKWIHHHFPEMPIILLLRHPCAVANSWLNLSWGFQDRGRYSDLHSCLSQQDLVNDFIGPFTEEIHKAKDDFEKHIFLWAILNYVPLKQFRPDELYLAFYENFCQNPIDETRRLFDYLNKELYDDIETAIRKPSAVARKESAIVTGTNLIDSWRDNIDQSQVRRAEEILELFGLSKIYSTESLPNVQASIDFMATNG